MHALTLNPPNVINSQNNDKVSHSADPNLSVEKKSV